MSAGLAIGVDVGGTKTAALRVSARGQVLDRSVHRTPADDQDATLETIEEAVEAVLDDGVDAIGVGAAGLVDVADGVLLSSPNLSWRMVHLGKELNSRFGLPVTVDNDATAAAWAEYRIGASRGRGTRCSWGSGPGSAGDRLARDADTRGARPGGRDRARDRGTGRSPVRLRQPRMLGTGRQRVGDLEGGERAVLDDPAPSWRMRRRRSEPHLRLVTKAAKAGDPTSIAILAEVGRRLGEGSRGS